MGTDGEFDIDPQLTDSGALGLTDDGLFMICGKCCQQPVIVDACPCGPCCFTSQSRIRITWQLLDYGNEQDRCCCADSAFLSNSVEIPFSCGAWVPPNYCIGCSHSGLIGGHPQPNCESDTINGPRWQGYGIPLPGASCGCSIDAMVIAGCDGDGTTRWYVAVDANPNEDSTDKCGRIFAACIPSAPGSCRSASITTDELHNHCVCTSVWDIYSNPARVRLEIEVLDETVCMDDQGNCVLGDSNGDGSCQTPPGI